MYTLTVKSYVTIRLCNALTLLVLKLHYPDFSATLIYSTKLTQRVGDLD